MMLHLDNVTCHWEDYLSGKKFRQHCCRFWTPMKNMQHVAAFQDMQKVIRSDMLHHTDFAAISPSWQIKKKITQCKISFISIVSSQNCKLIHLKTLNLWQLEIGHVGRQLNTNQPIFSNNTIENIWTSQVNNSSTIGPNDLKFNKESQHYLGLTDLN